MRHHNANRKFGRERDQRKALLRTLAVSLIRYGKIRTTVEKAKELRPFVEKLVTRAKEPTLNSRRILRSRIGHPGSASKLITDIAPKYKARQGGYTRILRLPGFKKDGSSVAQIEFV